MPSGFPVGLEEFEQPGLAPAQGVRQAIQLVDDHFGINRMLGLPHIRLMVRTLARRGEVGKARGVV